MHIALVVNPKAGKGKGAELRAQSVARLRTRADVRELVGASEEESQALCHQAVADGVDALVALGGDGMAHLAIQAVAGTFTPLGIIPAGTGNDLASHLGLPGKNPIEAADVVLAGHTRDIDAVRVAGETESWFGAVLGSGFDSAVNERANEMTWPRGDNRYILAMLATLPRFKPLHYTLTLDGEVWETEAMLVAVGNSRSYGGGMRVAPDAVLDDGLLEVCVLGAVGKFEFLRTFPKVYKGTHKTHPAVQIRRARTVTLDAPGVSAYADGEPMGPLPLTCECIPGALRVLVPGPT